MITLLRLGHRKERDKRITTHCGLVARALLADRFILCGERDDSVLESLSKVSSKWGGKFKSAYEPSPQRFLNREKKTGKSVLVHLTFYGIPLDDALPALRRKAAGKDLIVVVGAEKVPPYVYALADFNVSVTHQPHSEVAALALFLDHLQQGKELALRRQSAAFKSAQVKILAQAHGKRVVS